MISIQTDVYGTVVEFAYAGLDPIESRNFSLLTGKHEGLLNSAIYAHSNQLVYDWIEFFRGEWASALYQDNFFSFIQALKRSLHSDKGMIMLLNRVFEKADLTPGDAEVIEYRKTLTGSHGEAIPEITKKLIEAETIEYLRHNREFLTKYHIPSAH